MSEIQIRFINETNNESYEGSVDSNYTIKDIIDLLLKENEFSNLNANAILKTESGNIIDENKKFFELGLNDGTTVIVGQNGSNVDQAEGKVTEPLVPPSNISSPQQFHQLGIFVMDGSGSMNELTNGSIKKKDAVNMAIRDVLTCFKGSNNKNNFSFSVVAFDFSASVQTTTTPLVDIDENGNYDPTINHGSGTYIHTGLEEAKRIAGDFLSSPTNGVPHSVIILLLSDGECHEPEKTLKVANSIKKLEKINICTTILSRTGENNTNAENLMKDIATDTIIGFKRTYDPDTLRNFFVKSLSTSF
jgi:hypothetical protein